MPHIVAPTILQSLPLFTDLTDQDRDRLIRGGKMRRYASGENVFVFGETIRNFYVVCEGAIQLFRDTPDGHEMTTEVYIAGDTIGEIEILRLSTTHHFNALAIKASLLAEFPLNWLKESIKENGVLALNLLAMLSRRSHIATLEAEHKATMSAPQQVACFLERLCILHDFNPDGFDLPYSKTLIASRLGMELETFSRALAKIRNHGITVQGTHVTFHDIQEMEGFICGNCSIAGKCDEHNLLKQKLRKNPVANVR